MSAILYYYRNEAPGLVKTLGELGHSILKTPEEDLSANSLSQDYISYIIVSECIGPENLKRIFTLKELSKVPLIFLMMESNPVPQQDFQEYINGFIFWPCGEKQLSTILELSREDHQWKSKFKEKNIHTQYALQDYEIITDYNYSIKSINNTLELFIRSAPGEFSGKNIFDVFTIKDINHSPVNNFDRFIKAKQKMNFPGFFHYRDFYSLILFSIVENKSRNEYSLIIKNLFNNEALIKELIDIKFTLDQHSIIAITDHKGIIKYANEKFVDISGYTLEELIGKPQRIVNSGYHPPSFFKNLWDTLNSGKIWKGEIRNKTKNGTYYWVDTTIVPFLDSNQSPYQFIAIRTDITKRKNLETTQRENEFRYRTIAELTSDFIYCMEADETRNLKMIWITETFLNMTGYSSKEIEDKGFWKWEKIVHPEDLSSLQAHMKFIMTGRIDSSSFRIITKNGMIRWFQDLARPTRDENTGKTLIIGATKDITDMVQAEMAAERLLNFNESLLNSAGEGIIGLDNKGIIAFINPVASNLLARKEIELLGEDHLQAFYHTDKNGKKRSREDSPIFESLKSGSVVNINEDIFWRNDNMPIHVEYISSPIISDKIVTGSVVIFKDISLRLETERKIKEAREMAEQANRSKSEFLANMSHELRTPLNSIIGFSKLMKFTKSETEVQEFADYIHSSGTHLLRLINDLLDYSKIEAGKMLFDRIPVNLSKISEESITLIFLQAQQKGIEVLFNAGNSGDYCIIGDEKRLKQVIINLLSNAVKFTGKGGKIFVNVVCENGVISLSVKDTGIGMRQEDTEIIFENFTQLSSGLSRNSEGTGLGLAISKKIIEYHSGKITVISSPGEGSTFTISLPCFLKEKIDSNIENLSNLTDYPDSVKNKIFLIIDDDNSSRSLLEAFFLMNNQKFISVGKSLEGLEIFHNSHIDAVFTDLKMPEADGYEITRLIREIDHKIPVVAVSANQFDMPSHEIIGFLKKKGFDGYIPKPVDFLLFIKLLNEFIENNRL